MKKLLCLSVVCVGLSAFAQTPTNLVSWAAVPFPATQVAAYKRVDSVLATVRPSDGRVTVTVRFTLYDAAGNALRSGSEEFSQAALAAKLSANSETLARLKAIIAALAVP